MTRKLLNFRALLAMLLVGLTASTFALAQMNGNVYTLEADEEYPERVDIKVESPITFYNTNGPDAGMNGGGPYLVQFVPTQGNKLTGRFAPSFPTCPLFSTKLRPNRSAPTPPRKRTFALLSPVEPPLSSTELPSPSPTFPFSQRNCAPLSAHLCLSSYASLSSVRRTALVGYTCLRNPFYVEVQP